MHTYNALQLAAVPLHLSVPVLSPQPPGSTFEESLWRISWAHASIGRFQSQWEAKGNELILLPTLWVFVSVLHLPKRARLRTGPLSPTAPARLLHVAARSPAPKQKLLSHAGSWKLAFCEMPNFLFPPLLAIPQCPRPAQRQALSTRNTKLPLRKSQEQGRGEPQLRGPLASPLWLALFFPSALRVTLPGSMHSSELPRALCLASGEWK